MHQVALPEGHKEPDALYAGNILGKGFNFLVVQQVHVLHAHAVEIVFTLDLHGLGLNPVTVLPVGAVGGNLAQVDFRVEVGGKRIAVVAAVAVENVNGVDLIEIVLEGIGGEDTRHTWIEAGAEERGEPCRLEFLLICPLPGIIEIRGKALFLAALFVDGTPLRVVGILCLIVGGIDVIRTAGKARVHNGEILIGKRHVQDGVRLVFLHQLTQGIKAVSVHLGGGNHGLGGGAQLISEGIALRYGSRCNADLRKDGILTALVNGDRCNAAAADDE